MLSPATRASTRTVSHLVLAGYNPLAPPGRSAAAAAPSSRQAVSNPSPAQVPLSTWLASVGRETDVERGYRIKHVAGGAGHQLVSYRNYEGFGTTRNLTRGPSPSVALSLNLFLVQTASLLSAGTRQGSSASGSHHRRGHAHSWKGSKATRSSP